MKQQMNIRQHANFSPECDETSAGQLKLQKEDSADLIPGESFYAMKHHRPKLHKDMVSPSARLRNMPTQSIYKLKQELRKVSKKTRSDV